MGDPQPDRRVVAGWLVLLGGRAADAVRLQHGEEHRWGVHDFRSSGGPRADRGVEQASQDANQRASVSKGTRVSTRAAPRRRERNSRS